MSAFAEGPATAAEIFFSSGDVALAEMSGSALSMRPGDPISVYRLSGNRDVVVARGSVFRVRDEHVTVTISSGVARAGDRIGPWDGTSAVSASSEAAASATAFPSPERPPDPALSDGARSVVPYAVSEAAAAEPSRKILLYDIIGAPRILRDEFNRSFAAELSRQTSSADVEPSGENIPSHPNVMRAAGWRDREPARTEIREGARHRSADVVLLPVYLRSAEGDSVAVRVFDGKTGRQTGYSATRIQPFTRLEHILERKRVGNLELVERYSNVHPAPSTVYFSADGSLNVEASGERFMLAAGSARYMGAGSARPPGRHARVAIRGEVYDISTEWSSDGNRDLPQGGRVVISKDGLPLFASDYSSPPFVAAQGLEVSVLAGSTLERLRIIP